MTTSHSTDACLPLMEACTLELYNQNIFRITGLPVDATPKQIARQAQKLQMLEEMGGGATGPEAAFALPTPPTSEDIRAALARMKDPQRRLVDEFFWFWPESDSTGSTDPAILAVAAGDADEAVKLWWTREQEGSEIAKHNLAVMYHMSAVDWTLHQFSCEIDHEREDKVKAYWKEAFDRWETLVESTEVRDVLKKRVREIDDEALTTGFVRRFLRELPMAFDQVNAHAALKLAELNRMDWARFHVDFMRQTHQGLDDVDTTAQMVLEPTKRRVEAHLKSFREKARATPEQGASLAANLLEQCRPMINLFDLFHGQEAHQRNDVFDGVAETILGMVIDHQRSTGDNRAFVGLLRDVLDLASGEQLRERITKNISIGEGNLAGEAATPFLERLTTIQKGKLSPAEKLLKVEQEVDRELPTLLSKIGGSSGVGDELKDSVAITIRAIAIDVYNQDHQYNRAVIRALEFARQFATARETKSRLNEDLETIRSDSGMGTCFFCGKNRGESNHKISVPMHKVTDFGLKYFKRKVEVSRCRACYVSHRKHWKIMWLGALVGAVLGSVIVPWSSVIGCALAGLFLGGWILVSLAKTSSGNSQLIGIGFLMGLLFLGALCVDLANEAYGRSIFLNILGGSIVVGFVTFWVARKVLYEESPNALALKDPKVMAAARDGWNYGESP